MEELLQIVAVVRDFFLHSGGPTDQTQCQITVGNTKLKRTHSTSVFKVPVTGMSRVEP